MIYLTNSLSELNKHPNTIACRTKTTQDRPEIVQVLYCTRDFGVKGA